MARLSVRGVTLGLAERGVLVTDKAVYGWVAGRIVPRHQHAEALVALSRGELSFPDVYRHKHEVLGGGNGAVTEKLTRGIR